MTRACIRTYPAILLLHFGSRLILALLLTGRLLRAIQGRPQQLQLAGKEVSQLLLRRKVIVAWEIRRPHRWHSELPDANAIVVARLQVPGYHREGLAGQESVLPSELPPAHPLFPHHPGVILGQPWLSGIHDSRRQMFGGQIFWRKDAAQRKPHTRPSRDLYDVSQVPHMEHT